MGSISTKPKGSDRRKNGVQVFDKTNRISSKLEREMLEKMDKIQQEYLWISSNEEKLKHNHLNEYIAVKDKKVAFSSGDFEALLQVMLASKQDLDTFAVKRVTKDPTCLLL
jgi:hypothetical protein